MVIKAHYIGQKEDSYWLFKPVQIQNWHPESGSVVRLDYHASIFDKYAEVVNQCHLWPVIGNDIWYEIISKKRRN